MEHLDYEQLFFWKDKKFERKDGEYFIQLNLVPVQVDEDDMMYYQNKQFKIMQHKKTFNGHELPHKQRLFGKWYNEIYECNVPHMDNARLDHSFWSIVPDSIFFNFEDRETALARIDPFNAEYFKKIGYLKWNESKLIEYLTKRICNRK